MREDEKAGAMRNEQWASCAARRGSKRFNSFDGYCEHTASERSNIPRNATETAEADESCDQILWGHRIIIH